MSSISLVLCFIDFLFGGIHTDFHETQSYSNAIETQDGLQSSFDSWLDSKSIFFPSVICLLCTVLFFTKLIFQLLFGKLTVLDKSKLSGMFSRFILLRLVILWGAINVFRLSSIFAWLIWFSALGVLNSIHILIASRCTRFAASTKISRNEWLRVGATFCILLVGNWFLLTSGWNNRYKLADVVGNDLDYESTTHALPITGLKTPTALGVIIPKLLGRKAPIYETMDIVVYMFLECLLLLILIANCLGEFLIQLYDRWKLSFGSSWPKQTLFTYYLDLINVSVYHNILILYYMHLLLWSRIFSIASLIFFHHIRSAYTVLLIRVRRHLSYRKLAKYVERNFKLFSVPVELVPTDYQPPQSSEIQTQEDKISPQTCAVCWDPMYSWRRLPCNHDFHDYCLRNWLEQNPSCPTCRRHLDIPVSILPTVQPRPIFNFALPNILRHLDNGLAATPTTGQLPTGNQLSPGQRGLFATTVGLNLGVSIGSMSMGGQQQLDASHSRTETSDPSVGEESSRSTVRDGSSISTSSALPGQPSVDESAGQVHHRSFHFDGSRYFSWLPSLQIELSQVIREVLSGGANPHLSTNSVSEQVTDETNPEDSPMTTIQPDGSFDPTAHELIRLPQSLRGAAQELAVMLPQFPLSTIVADLLLTRVPEVTVENLIRLPIPATSRPWTSMIPSTSAEPSGMNPGCLPSLSGSNQYPTSTSNPVESENQESTTRSRSQPNQP